MNKENESMPLADILMKGGSETVHIFTGKITVPEEGGMNLHHEGLKYPKKGFPFLEGAFVNNFAKRHTMGIVMSIANRNMLLPIIGFLVTPRKKKIAAIENFLRYYVKEMDTIFVDLFMILMAARPKDDEPEKVKYRSVTPPPQVFSRGLYFKRQFMTPCAQEIMTRLNIFMQDVGVDESQSIHVSTAFATMIENDDAYRYRIEDIMSETSVESLMKKPVREIKRLLGIHASREVFMKNELPKKFKAFGNAISVLMILSPRIRKAFRHAINRPGFKHLQLDEADRYHVLMRGDYNFLGKDEAERKAEFLKINGDKDIRGVKYEAIT